MRRTIPPIQHLAGMSPVDVVVDIFGGIRSVARAINVAPSTVLRWGTSRRGGRIPGSIPHEYMLPLMEAAMRRRKRLTLEEVVWGRPKVHRKVITFLSPSERLDPLDQMARTLAGLSDCPA